MFTSCILLICCVLFHGIPTLSADEENKIVHYVAIDIDDIFQPNWDSELHQIGTVKMDETDVDALIELTHNLRLSFGEEFSFSIGYNSGYYDSTNSGDKAFLKNASYFAWFNHLPFHQHILQYSYTYEQIEELIIAGNNFENAHGLTDFTGGYMVTPLHDGLWNPYDPIYDIFEKYGIYYSSTPMVNRPASFGKVKIITRYLMGLGSSDYSFEHESEERIDDYSIKTYNIIMNKETVIFYTH